MSDTPRTDARIVESILCTEGGDEECTVYPAVEHVEADFAREMEGEIARLKEWNAQRTGQFACTEQRLAIQIAKLRETMAWLATCGPTVIPSGQQDGQHNMREAARRCMVEVFPGWGT